MARNAGIDSIGVRGETLIFAKLMSPTGMLDASQNAFRMA